MICLGKTKSGIGCNNITTDKYCYLHKSQNSNVDTKLNLSEFKNLEQLILDSDVDEINKNTKEILDTDSIDDVCNYIKFIKDFTVQYNPSFLNSLRINTISVLDSLINIGDPKFLNKIKVCLHNI